MLTPKALTLRASALKVRTTPLTWGCQASVATRTRIGPALGRDGSAPSLSNHV